MIEELSGDQIRIHTNACQVYETWREADQKFHHSYKGRMNWSKIRGTDYLYRIVGRSRKSLGPRSPETEKIKEEYTAQRKRLKQRTGRLQNKLDELAPINRAYRLGRVPVIAAKILRELDRQELLGEHLMVVGTHSLYAYEAAAGVRLQDDLIATGDIDFLWDVRKKLKFIILDSNPGGIMGILKKIDPTFSKSSQSYRAGNDDGYLVDLIRPAENNEMDLEAAAIMGLQWLINAPRFEQIAIAEDGYPVRICCIDPRAFALYKRWLAYEADNREPAKRNRDKAQSKAAATLAKKHLNLKFNKKELSALPMSLVQHAKEL